jgi:hypothetical protein
LKVLSAEVAGNVGRLARFEQEARAAAALNHPKPTTQSRGSVVHRLR